MVKKEYEDERLDRFSDFLGEIAQLLSTGAMLAHNARVAVDSFGKFQESVKDHEEELERQYELMEASLHE